MKKLTALLTTLALGSGTSIALASPVRSYDRRTGVEASFAQRPVAARYGASPWQRDAPPHRFDRRYDRIDRSYGRWDQHSAADEFGPRRYRTTWVALSTGAPAARGQQCIEVSDRGTFTQLRVQADSGRARVGRVVVEFADGSSQVAQLDRVLAGFIDIPLDGNNRRIDRIVVTGARGDLQVFAI